MTAHNKELNPERLLQLSDEVGRIASTLARLSADQGRTTFGASTSGPDLSVDSVRAVIHARRLRASYFAADLFADPAWDMMLELLKAELSQHRVTVSNLCAAAADPATTALRWLNAIVEKGLFVRRDDPHDGRRAYVELAPDTSRALRHYFAQLPSVTTI